MKFLARQVAFARHERQFGIHLRDDLECDAALLAGTHQIERGVGIAAETITRLAIDDPLGHQLRDHVDATRQQIRRRVGVVRRDVVLLRIGITEPFSGKEEKLDDLDVRRQGLGVERLGVVQIGIAAEQAIDDRPDKPLLKGGRWSRLFQRQCREDRQMDRWIGHRAPEQRIDDVIRLAQPERQPDDQPRPDVADNVVRDRFRIGKDFRHRISAD